MPQALIDEYGGWEDDRIVDDFVNYSTTLFKAYGNKVKYWIVLNEQNVFTSMGWVTAQHPPGKLNDQKEFYQVNHRANLAHAKSVIAYKELGFKGKIGSSFAYTPSYAKDCEPANAMSKMNYDDLRNFWWMDVYAYGRYPKAAYNYLDKLGIAPAVSVDDAAILKKASELIDFMGVNYYQTTVTEFNPADGATPFGAMNTTGVKGSGEVRGMQGVYKNPPNPYLKTTDWDWTIDPDGLKYACREITSRYNLPVVISENGLGAFDKKEADGSIHDPYRIAYLEAHIKALIESMEQGCEVLAYCTWSFTDLLSWLNGYQKRYGFIYVDRDEEGGTMNRYKKDSYFWYKDIISTNGENLINRDKDTKIM
jgi:6-phospho-beta-glucosidase